MKLRLRDKIAFVLESIPVLWPLIFRLDGEAPKGKRYINRINGHVVVITEKGELF